MPKDKSRAGDLLNAEEVELLAKDAVIARLDLFKVFEVRIEVFLVEEGSSVNALQLLVVFLTKPISARDGHDLERLHAARGGNMGTSTEVSELAVPVEGYGVALFGEALDEVKLHELGGSRVVSDGLLARFGDVKKLIVPGDDLRHAGFDGGEVGLGEWHLTIDVVEEAIVRSWAMSQLRLGEELKDGGGHHVRSGVAHDLQSSGVRLLEQLKADGFGERLGEVNDTFGRCRGSGIHRLLGCFQSGLVGIGGGGRERLNSGDNDGCGQAWGDAVRDVERCCAGGDFANGAVRELDVNQVVLV